jgi:hypothetical protein
LKKGFDKAVTRATKVLKHIVDATADEIVQEMKEAAQGYSHRRCLWPFPLQRAGADLT